MSEYQAFRDCLKDYQWGVEYVGWMRELVENTLMESFSTSEQHLKRLWNFRKGNMHPNRLAVGKICGIIEELRARALDRLNDRASLADMIDDILSISTLDGVLAARVGKGSRGDHATCGWAYKPDPRVVDPDNRERLRHATVCLEAILGELYISREVPKGSRRTYLEDREKTYRFKFQQSCPTGVWEPRVPPQYICYSFTHQCAIKWSEYHLNRAWNSAECASIAKTVISTPGFQAACWRKKIVRCFLDNLEHVEQHLKDGLLVDPMNALRSLVCANKKDLAKSTPILSNINTVLRSMSPSKTSKVSSGTISASARSHAPITDELGKKLNKFPQVSQDILRDLLDRYTSQAKGKTVSGNVLSILSFFREVASGHNVCITEVQSLFERLREEMSK